MKTLAAFKRALALGSRWRVEILPGAFFKTWAGTDETVIDREVTVVQTNGVFLTVPDGRQSWLEFGPAGGWRFEDGSALMLNKTNGQPMLRYTPLP